MNDEDVIWSVECQKQWKSMHEYAEEKDTTSVANCILLLIIALQRSQLIPLSAGKSVVYLSKRLRNSDSPIYLLAHKFQLENGKKKAEKRFKLPQIDEKGTVTLLPVQFQLFVQLENYAQHKKIVDGEWSGAEKHAEALEQAGFLFD